METFQLSYKGKQKIRDAMLLLESFQNPLYPLSKPTLFSFWTFNQIRGFKSVVCTQIRFCLQKQSLPGLVVMMPSAISMR